MKPPCYQCKDRQIGCHGSCERYKEYHEFFVELQAKRRDAKIVNDHIADRVAKSVKLKIWMNK